MRRKNRKNDSYKVVIIGSVAILVIIALIAVATLIKAEPMSGSNVTPIPTPVATVVRQSNIPTINEYTIYQNGLPGVCGHLYFGRYDFHFKVKENSMSLLISACITSDDGAQQIRGQFGDDLNALKPTTLEELKKQVVQLASNDLSGPIFSYINVEMVVLTNTPLTPTRKY